MILLKKPGKDEFFSANRVRKIPIVFVDNSASEEGNVPVPAKVNVTHWVVQAAYVYSDLQDRPQDIEWIDVMESFVEENATKCVEALEKEITANKGA